MRKLEKNELGILVDLFRETFKVHNVFQLSYNKVLSYLQKTRGDFIVAEENGEIIAALAIVTEVKTRQHKRVRFKHIAVKEEFQGKGVGSDLIKKAEQIVGKGKIEIHVAEGEKEPIEFYKKNGYEIEGVLKDHYRMGEMCTIMGKVLKWKLKY